MNNRRKLVLALGAGVLGRPLRGWAQQPPQKVFRVGILFFGTAASAPHLVDAFTHALRDAGYIEGNNLTIERRFADGNHERLQALAAELAIQKVDVIFAPTSVTVEAAKQVTSTIPIVFAATADPIGSGFIVSLARPGGNITGMSTISPNLSAKRLQLVKETFPKISRVAVLASGEATDAAQVAEVQRAAKALGMDASLIPTRGGKDLEQGVALLRKWRADSMYVVESPTHFSSRKILAEIAVKNRLPAIYPAKDYVDVGGLMSYGPNYATNYRRSANYVDKILKGAKPGDLPVEQPTTFELAINLRTAKATGINLSQSILIRADTVIE